MRNTLPKAFGRGRVCRFALLSFSRPDLVNSTGTRRPQKHRHRSSYLMLPMGKKWNDLLRLAGQNNSSRDTSFDS